MRGLRSDENSLGLCAAGAVLQRSHRVRERRGKMAQALDIVGLLKKLALIEQEGVAFYESLAEHTRNEKIRKLAVTMSHVEKTHQERFERLVLDFKKRGKGKPSDRMTADVRQYILALIDHRIFLSPREARVAAENITDENEAVDMAIRFEKENILLLAECREIVRGKTRKLIETFIGQEKAHVRSLEKIRRQLAGTP